MNPDEVTLQRLVDRQEISDLITRYFVAVDRRRFDDVIGCFASPDTPVDYSALLPSTAGMTIGGVVRTIEAAMEKYASTVHAMSNHEVELEGHRARSEVWATAHHVYADPPPGGEGRIPVIGLRYRDEITRTDLGWRITTRTALADWRGWMEGRDHPYR